MKKRGTVRGEREEAEREREQKSEFVREKELAEDFKTSGKKGKDKTKQNKT